MSDAEKPAPRTIYRICRNGSGAACSRTPALPLASAENMSARAALTDTAPGSVTGDAATLVRSGSGFP